MLKIVALKLNLDLRGLNLATFQLENNLPQKKAKLPHFDMICILGMNKGALISKHSFQKIFDAVFYMKMIFLGLFLGALHNHSWFNIIYFLDI